MLSPDVYFYYPGIQGYFDYSSALMLIDEYKTPQNIDFNKCKELHRNAYYTLAVISIQKFAYLITNNESIDSTINNYFKNELLFFALRHTNPSDAEQYKTKLLQLMADDAETLKTITNNIVLPLARESQHPLSTPLLNEFLLGFEHPAQRDVLWSVPSYLKESDGEKWDSSSELALDRASYSLTDVDTADGLPIVYAWALSTVDNARRQTYRIELMKWSRQLPNEFYKLFLKFSSVNDPQIRSDMFSILMSLLFEDENMELLDTATKWLMGNILAPDKIEENRDIAIRHYSTSIVRKAASLNIVDLGTALKYLPPFAPATNDIALSKEALAGTYMDGYGGISYDLGRYVLIDHITGVFPNHGEKVKKQYEKLIGNIAKNNPVFAGISSTQFILSAAYKFIAMCGWNEEFRYHEIDGEIIRGVDWAISGSHWPKTHGSQSPVMTICEKYVWQARNYISGFLADRLMHVDDDGASYADDYGLLDDFLIPALEIGPIDPDSMNNLYPWHVPERNAVIISGKPNSKDDVVHAVQTSPLITWKEWVQLENSDHHYPVDAQNLIVLSGYSCFESSAGVETNLYLSTILIASSDVDSFIKKLNEDSELSCRVSNPFDWKGSYNNAHCYVTPKEICWMPWKKRYDSSNVYDFPELKIHSAVDKCTYNFIEHGDVYYEFPSAPIRERLKITNTDGYLFYDHDKQIKAANIWVGERLRTQQCYLLVDRDLLHDVEQNGNTLLWIMRENRRESRKAKERFGNFYEEKDRSYVGFFRNDEFAVIQIFPSKGRKVDGGENDDSLSSIIDQYGYRNETV